MIDHYDRPYYKKYPDKTRVIKERRYVTCSLRHKILRRDRYRCVQCGRSPANDTGVELQVDHIIPIAKGGKSIEENLQTLCKDCNLGKGSS